MHLLWMLGFGALVLFALYRRFRRNFGRQPLRPVPMGIRIGLLAVIGLLLTTVGLHSAQAYGAIALGGAIGLALGIFAAERTRFEVQANKIYYIPHTYVGIAVSALFLARLLYRFAQLYSAGGPAGVPPSTMMSPLILGVFFVLISYNVYYGARVLWKSRHIRPEDVETASTPL